MGKNIIITEKQFDYIIKNMRKMPMLNEIYQETRNDSYPISLNETNAKKLGFTDEKIAEIKNFA